MMIILIYKKNSQWGWFVLFVWEKGRKKDVLIAMGYYFA